MAGGHKVTLNGYSLMTKPHSRFRRITGDPWPYSQGGHPSFDVHVSALEDHDVEQEFVWCLWFSNTDRAYTRATIPPLKEGETSQVTVGDRLLGFTGDVVLIVPSPLRNPDGTVNTSVQKYATLYCMHVVHRAWIAQLIASAVIGSVLTMLIQQIV